jgi:U3 small nucleolar RNA-associated protein 20
VYVTQAEFVSEFSNLDSCVDDIVHVSAEVVFGQSGKDVLSEDFRTKMREVRGSNSRGMDSFALIAKHITPGKVNKLLLPIRNIMEETESTKIMQLVDELLKRLASGLNSNHHITPQDLLVLCHTLVSQNARFLQQTPHKSDANSDAKIHRDIHVRVKRKAESQSSHYAVNSYRFVVKFC